MKVYGQLESACVEQLSSDPGTNVAGRIFYNTTDTRVKMDDGVNRYEFLRNDGKVVIGPTGSAAARIRLHRASLVGLFQVLTANDTTADGTYGFAVAQISARLQNATSSSPPAGTGAAYYGHAAFFTDTLKPAFYNGSYWDQAVSKSDFGSKGTIVVGTNIQQYQGLNVGSNNQVLTADSTSGYGVKWATIGARPQNVHNSAYTAAIGDGPCIIQVGPTFTITLPSASGNNGETLTFRRVDSSTAMVTFRVSIDGIANLDTGGEEVTMISDGTSWSVLSRYIPSYWVTLSTGEWSVTGWTTAASRQGRWRRVGNTIELQLYFIGSGPQASSAAIFLGALGLNLPSGIDSKFIYGTWASCAAAAPAPGTVYGSNNRFGFIGATSLTGAFHMSAAGASSVLFKSNGSSLGGSGDGFSIDMKVEVAAWGV